MEKGGCVPTDPTSLATKKGNPCIQKFVGPLQEWVGQYNKESGVRDKLKGGHLNKLWRANMWLFILLLSWVTGMVMSSNPSSKYTILEWELEFHWGWQGSSFLGDVWNIYTKGREMSVQWCEACRQEKILVGLKEGVHVYGLRELSQRNWKFQDLADAGLVPLIEGRMAEDI